ncbi:S9 family peptidase [Galactobacter caseinivorans]|uniref:S9 family peptidase n=1 Tax=Galactobacter caseinivorans TaxID=2676123 RepID=A0A496PLH0_9MICC|nr:S9 family peptidase [Galactobacter caseinivorans]RKW71377.1 S9 family peptidase [Galactobacter caseinivorans]
MTSTPQPPVAPQRPVSSTHHCDTRTDPWEWLREKESEEVLAHLRAEDAYAKAVTQDQEPLRQAIFDEIKARTVETDLSVPARERGWWYYARTEEGSQYAIHARVAATDTGDEEADWTPPVLTPGVPVPGEQILLDGNVEAQGHPFFSLGGLDVSHDGTRLAYAVDYSGDERFTLRVRDLTTGEDLPDLIEGTFYDPQLTPEGDRVIYTVVDDAWRPEKLMVHVLGTDPATDTVLFTETDPGMWLGGYSSPDGKDLLINVGNSEYGETWIWPGMDPDVAPVMIVDRELRLLHQALPVILDGERRLVILHDHEAPNGLLSLAPAAGGVPSEWTTLIPTSNEVKLGGLEATSTHLVLSVREDTTPRVWTLPLDGLGTPAQAAPSTPLLEVPAVAGGTQARAVVPVTIAFRSAAFESPYLRLTRVGDLLPAEVHDVRASDGAARLLKTTPVRGISLDDYAVHREWATAQDGTQIPLTVMHRRDVAADGTAPLVVYGYGSYEASMDPVFSVARLSLLDRGVVYAVAHVRGGGERGRDWYLQGKKLTKLNTFTDFIDSTRWLLEHGWGQPGRVAAMGGSAGGLLMGAVANMAPELYAAVLAQVPFVDPLTSILDPELPLSAMEWEEWGNPIEDPQVYAYMKAYSPYENLRAVDYPLIAARTSLNDTRVLYVEPAKWVQALRQVSTSEHPVVMTIEMDGGHGGASGRYEGWKDRAWDQAFVLSAVNARSLVPGAEKG